MAANQKGIFLVNELINQYGLEVVQAYMHYGAWFRSSSCFRS